MGSSSSGPATMGRLRDPELIPYAAVLLLTLLVVTTYNASVGHAPAGPICWGIQSGVSHPMNSWAFSPCISSLEMHGEPTATCQT